MTAPVGMVCENAYRSVGGSAVVCRIFSPFGCKEHLFREYIYQALVKDRPFNNNNLNT